MRLRKPLVKEDSLQATESRPLPPGGLRGLFTILGPGLVIAATGVGAGDLVAATVAGSRYGLAVAWAALAGAVLKFTLNEGLARWQLTTGTTLMEGWALHLGRWVHYVFLVYLVIWSFVVGGALITACGLAAHAIAPALSMKVWGVVHSLAAVTVVIVSGYGSFERLMKLFIGTMFVALVGSACWMAPGDMAGGAVLAARVPEGGIGYLLGVIGGVGGSVTLLSYGYWMRERGWSGLGWLRAARIDLAVAYVLTGLFGVAVVVLAARTLHVDAVAVQGSDSVLRMAAMLDSGLGSAGRWAFLVGFWGAVATSMLGVWQGVPYLFCDFVSLMKRDTSERRAEAVSTRSPWYRGYLLWLAAAPISLLFFDRPVAIVVAYSILGALFMPFLAATLLYLGFRGGKGDSSYTNRWPSVAGLVLCLVLFGYLAVRQVAAWL